MDIFVKLTNIKGESQDKTHAGEISALGWGWSMSQPSNMHMDGGGGAAKAWVGDLTFQHYLDRASPTLVMKCLTGEHITQAVLVVRKAGKHPLEYIRITMTDVVISNVTPYGEGAQAVTMESVSLSFAEVLIEYTEQKKDGTAGATVSAYFNIKQNAQN